MTDMTVVYILEWTFTPPDYLEAPVDFASDSGLIHVENGKADARVPADLYQTDHSLRNQLHGELDAVFLAAQVLSHKHYDLSKSSVSKLYSDGRKDAWVFPESGTIAIKGGDVDFVHKDSAGNVIRDTKKERIQRRIEFVKSTARHLNNALTLALLRSYSAAVNDPRNELVHLYEIRDALSQQFGSEATAMSAANITKKEWSRLGQLANYEPIIQGRHRGKSFGSLREATAVELSEAREIAHKMIEGYLCHLNNENEGR